MKRREFFERAGIGSAALASLSAMTSGDTNAKAKESEGHGHDGQGHTPLDGPLANAVVNFGQWRSDFNPPLNRFPNVPPLPAHNNHGVLPFEATIKAGGSVSFIISGLHLITVYDDGSEPTQIDVVNNLQATTGVPLGVPVINDAVRRIYRGPDPSLLGTLDRVESVHFPNPGRYLVICSIRPHFVNPNPMHGFVKVLP